MGNIYPISLGLQDFATESLSHPFYTFDYVLCVGLERGPGDRTYESHGRPIDAKAEIIEDRVIRQHDKLMTNFLNEPRLASLTPDERIVVTTLRERYAARQKK